jgi:hypothetical protein
MSLGLGEEIGEEDAVVGCVAGAGAEGVVRVGDGNKIGALVREFVELLLAIGACCAPDVRLKKGLALCEYRWGGPTPIW